MDKKKLAVIIGVAVVAVVLAVLLPILLANHRPAIVNLEAEPERVAPSGTVQIVCNATDSDDDELSYGWSADGGTISGEGPAVTWTAPGPVGSYNVTVIVLDSHGNGVTDLVTVTVRRNNAPVINSLAADSIWTLPSGSLNVTCDASDPDEDELSYEWTASGGSISGTGAAVTWAAPQEVAVYNITVVVRDGHGREDTRLIPLSVVTGTPPTIEDLVITAKEPKYFKEKAAGYYKVGRTKQYDIECIVSNTSGEVFYEWSCQDGTISGEGSMITWTAPDEQLSRTTVTVIVSDVADNKVSKGIDFEVVQCNSCSFG